MLHLPQELHDVELFRELPDLTKTPGSEGRGLNWDGSFADAYIKRLQYLRPSGGGGASDGGEDSPEPPPERGLHDCFLALEQFILGYLEQGQPIRRLPSSRQTFRRTEGGTVELDYFVEMDIGGSQGGHSEKARPAVLSEYRQELEKRGKILKWYQPYLKHQNTLLRSLFRFVLGAVPLGAAGWLLFARPQELLPALLALFLAVLGAVLMTRWSGALSYRAVLRSYRAFLEKDERLLEYYRYARFCQLWCSVEGRQMPEALDLGLDEINQAIANYRSIFRFYPELM